MGEVITDPAINANDGLLNVLHAIHHTRRE